jgi:hypothetical protein
MLRIRARLYSLRKSSLDQGHGFAGCGKTHVLCQGTTLVGPYKNSFEGFSPWAFSLSSGGKTPALLRLSLDMGYVRDAP